MLEDQELQTFYGWDNQKQAKKSYFHHSPLKKNERVGGSKNLLAWIHKSDMADDNTDISSD